MQTARRFRLIIPLALLLFAALALSRPASADLRAQGNVPVAVPVYNVAVQPGEPDVVLAGVENRPNASGIYRSTDGAVSWANVADGIPASTSIAGLTFDPRDENFVLASDAAGGLIYRSEDGGESWEALPQVRAILPEGDPVSEIYAVVEEGGTVFYVGTRVSGLIRTIDRGETWEQFSGGLAGGPARRIGEVAEFRDSLFVGTYAGLYQLAADGSLWIFVPSFPNGANVTVYSLATHGSGDSAVLYAGTAAGLFRSVDSVNWQAVPGVPPLAVRDLVSTGSRVVAATSGGIYAGPADFASTEAWTQPLINGVPYAGNSFAVGNAEDAPRTVYVGTATDWVLRSDDEGVTFNTLQSMPPLDVEAALATASPTPTPSPTPDRNGHAHRHAHAFGHGHLYAAAHRNAHANPVADGNLYAGADAHAQRHAHRHARPRRPRRPKRRPKPQRQPKRPYPPTRRCRRTRPLSPLASATRSILPSIPRQRHRPSTRALRRRRPSPSTLSSRSPSK